MLLLALLLAGRGAEAAANVESMGIARDVWGVRAEAARYEEERRDEYVAIAVACSAPFSGRARSILLYSAQGRTQSMVRLPYSRTLQRKSELLALEQDLRTLLQCQGRQCAFLQSSEYATVKFNILRALLGSSQPPQEEQVIVRIPGSTLLMHVSMDSTHRRADIVVQSQPFLAAATAQEEEEEQQSGHAMKEEEEDDKERKRKALLHLCTTTQKGGKRGRRSYGVAEGSST